MELSSQKRKGRNAINVLIISFITVCLLSTVFITSAFASNPTDFRNQLWQNGSVTTAEATDILTEAALKKYISAGVFGKECKENLSNDTSNSSVKSICPSAASFYNDNQVYAQRIADQMKRDDEDGTRWAAAIDRVNKFSKTLISTLIGFGFLIAALVFVVSFMKIAFAPNHAMQKRSLTIDLMTSCVSVALLGNMWIVVSLFYSSFGRFWYTYTVYSKDWRSVVNMLFAELKFFISGISGVATFFVFAMFIYNFAMLALQSNSANKRSERMSSLLLCGAATAGLGSLALILPVVWNLISV